jgi:hypothetical protein
MTQPWIRVTPRAVNFVEYCEQCEEPIAERWDESKRRCARCSLDAELFDREERRLRLGQPA